MFKTTLSLYRLVLNGGNGPLSVTKARSAAAVFLFLFLCTSAYGAGGEEIETSSANPPRCHHGCCFVPSIELNGEVLSLRGTGTFRYWGFRVYTGALYAPPTAQSRDAIRGEVRKKLVLCYHRSVSPDQFREKSQEVLEDTPGVELSALEPQLSAINKAYVGVKEGDRYAITYEPETGTMKLWFNEREPELIAISSTAFARTYFGIWLSEYSVGKEFTAEVFGERG